MDNSKFDRTVAMRCPTCAGTQFDFDPAVEDDSAPITCASCNRTMTRRDLKDASSELIEAQAKEVGEQAAKAVADELRKTLKNAFKNSKTFTIK